MFTALWREQEPVYQPIGQFDGGGFKQKIMPAPIVLAILIRHYRRC